MDFVVLDWSKSVVTVFALLLRVSSWFIVILLAFAPLYTPLRMLFVVLVCHLHFLIIVLPLIMISIYGRFTTIHTFLLLSGYIC